MYYTLYSNKGGRVMKISVLVGSLRKDSSNMALATYLEKIAPKEMQFNYIDINLPLYNEDIERMGMPAEVQQAKDIVAGSDGILFVSPEYNRSVPGVLKNAIDWISRPYGKSSFENKPVGMVGSSMGPVGTAVSQTDLRHIMLFQNAKVLGQPEIYIANAYEVFDKDGNVVSERWRKK